MNLFEATMLGTNLGALILLAAQAVRHRNYRRRVHRLLGEEPAENEAQMIADDVLRVTAALNQPKPEPGQFVQHLLSMDSFVTAVAHEKLHRVHVETQGALHGQAIR